MRDLFFTVPGQYEGVRLGGFLRGYCEVSARMLATLKHWPEGIRVNGLPARAPDLLRAGDTVHLRLPEDTKLAEPVPLPFSVLYADAYVVAVDKPHDMPMYPCPGHHRDSLANAAASWSAGREERVAFRPVYRLDRDTTGVAVLARDAYTAARLAGRVRKLYYAVCEGQLAGHGTVDAPLGLAPGSRIRRCVSEHGERAVTHWEALAAGKGHTLLRIQLDTGRTHQIRAHFSHIGHPLAGDDMYGGSLLQIPRQALHCGEAWLIPFPGEKEREIIAPFPEDLRQFCDACGLSRAIPPGLRRIPPEKTDRH